MEILITIIQVFAVLFTIVGLILIIMGYRTTSKIIKNVEEDINEQRKSN